MAKRTAKSLIPGLCKNLDYLLGFLKEPAEVRRTRPLLTTSPYYRWLTYTLIRRELFEEIKTFANSADFAHGMLIDYAEGLKAWGLDPIVRQGLIHEALYWVASLHAQQLATRPFVIAPIHEGIPALSSAALSKDEKIHFRGDFVAFWSEGGKGCSAVIDVKADFGSALEDKYLRKTAKLYAQMGIGFYLVSPARTMSDFDRMRRAKYLLRMAEWSHRPFPFDYDLGPYPKPVEVPWLRRAQPK